MTPDFESRARVLDLDLTRSSVSPDRYASEATHSAWRLYLHLQERAVPVTPPQSGALANSGVPLTSVAYQHRYLTEALARTETMADHRGVCAHERFEALFARPHGLPIERVVSNTRYESFETEWAFRAWDQAFRTWGQAIESLDTFPAELQEQIAMLGRK